MNKKKIFIALGVVVIAVIGSLIAGYLIIDQHTHRPINTTGENIHYVEIEIETGMLPGDVNELLSHHGLIRSTATANWIVRLNNWGGIQAGIYSLSQGMSLSDMYGMFIAGRVVEEETIRVTIPEGETLEFIAHAFAEGLGFDENELMVLWSNVAFLEELVDAYWFLTDEIFGEDIIHPLEGYFYPITYFIPVSLDDPKELTHILLDMTEHRIADLRDEIEEHEMTFHDILTFASIIEAETQEDDEMLMVSGVFHNRLEIEKQFQSCATVQYVWPERRTHVTYEMTQVDSPYNTYRNAGLPPGAVNSPSIHAIHAVMNPVDHDYLFFISDMFNCIDGRTHFFTNYTDHSNFRRENLDPSYQAGESMCDPDVQVVN